MSVDELRYLNGPVPFDELQERLQKPRKGAAALERHAKRQGRLRSRGQLRALVYREDGGKCRRCGKRLQLHLRDCSGAGDPFLQVAHVDEWIKRSLGGDWLDPTNCLVLCASCHDLVDDRKLFIVPSDPVRLVRGPVDFIPGPLVVYCPPREVRS